MRPVMRPVVKNQLEKAGIRPDEVLNGVYGEEK